MRCVSHGFGLHGISDRDPQQIGMVRKIARSRSVSRPLDLHCGKRREAFRQNLHNCGAGRSYKFDLRTRRIDRRVHQQLERRWSRDGQRSVRALDCAAAHVEGRAHPLVDCERLRADRRTNDVDHRVNGANFVEVNLLQRSVVNLRLGRTERFEYVNRRYFRGFVNRGLFDDLANLRQAARVRVGG